MAFAEEFCFPFLLRAQNADGGWGYTPGSRSGVEPTCWALLALNSAFKLQNSTAKEDHPVLRGYEWLRRAPLPDGSWPAFVGQQRGCWVTALACLALRTHEQSRELVRRGVEWLCDLWPAEGGLWSRIAELLRRAPPVARQNSSLRGWAWTPGTASWVEPTAYALILLKNLAWDLLPLSSRKRVRLAEAMLYDRMCVGGGWNAGNPLVYGVALVPRIGPTAWALLALLDRRHRQENQRSLDWLAAASVESPGPGSLALAHLCLEAYAKAGNFEFRSPNFDLEMLLRRQQAVNQFLLNVVVVAWAAIALNGVPDWIMRGSQESEVKEHLGHGSR